MALHICDRVIPKFAYGLTQFISIAIFATSIANIMIKGFTFFNVMISVAFLEKKKKKIKERISF